MSYQAMAWAIEQDVESPSARCVLMSIANYANEDWCAWPKQELIAKEGVQSVDSVQRRMPGLIGGGLVRRIKLKRFGRRTHDFYILKRSPYFEAPLEIVRPLLPSGCDVIEEAEAPESAAADCGSDKNKSPAATDGNHTDDAAADCGSSKNTTLPQSAVHAAAIVRQLNEPVKNQLSSPLPPSGGSRAAGLWERFKTVWTEPMVRPSVAEKVFGELPDARQQQAPQAASGYFAWLRSQGSRAPTAVSPQTFLREPEAFDRWCDYARPGVLPNSVSARLPRGSDEAKAVILLYELAGRASTVHGMMRLTDGSIAYRAEVTPALLALAQAPDKAAWPELNRQQAGAWNELIKNAVLADARMYLHEGARAPWVWPPSKEGKIYDSTAPPDQLMTDQDWNDAANMK